MVQNKTELELCENGWDNGIGIRAVPRSLEVGGARHWERGKEVREACQLGGSGGMLPQENFSFQTFGDGFWCNLANSPSHCAHGPCQIVVIARHGRRY